MQSVVKIKGMELVAQFVRFRRIDPEHERRETVTLLMEREYGMVKELFTEPGNWSVAEPVSGEISETDCTAYEVLCGITDRGGIMEIVMGKATEKELLAVLMGGN